MGIAIMGVVLFLLILVLVFVKSGSLFITIEHVPDGVEWRSHYRKMKKKRSRRAGPAVYLLVGLGVALLVIGAALAFLAT